MGHRSEKLYRRVIDAVLVDVESGRVPAEREVAEANGVSRATVWKAMVAPEMLNPVEIRKGSRIYVKAIRGAQDRAETFDIGALGLMEARRATESEIIALAARYITSTQLRRPEDLLTDMTNPDEPTAESADREFHIVIAEAAGNEAMISVATDLWDIRERAPLARAIPHRDQGSGLGS